MFSLFRSIFLNPFSSRPIEFQKADACTLWEIYMAVLIYWKR